MNAIARRGGAAQRTVLLLITVLVAVTSATVFAIPGYLDAHRGTALRAALAAAKDQVHVGVTETAVLDLRSSKAASDSALLAGDTWGTQALPQSLRDVVGAPTVTVVSKGGGSESDGSQTKLPLETINGKPPRFGLRPPYDSAGKLRTVAGQPAPMPTDSTLPGPAPDRTGHPAVWGWISQAAADKIHVSVGDRIVTSSAQWSTAVDVTIAGIFAPTDPSDPWWRVPDTGAPNDLGSAQIDTYYDPIEIEQYPVWRTDLMLDDKGAQLVGRGTNMNVTWSFPLIPSAITTGNVSRVVADVNRFKTGTNMLAYPKVVDPDAGESFDMFRSVAVSSPLPPILSGYLSHAGTSMVIMSLGLAVLAAVTIGVLALAVRLLIHRQRADLVVARARGASVLELVRSVGYQVSAAVAPAVAIALVAARAAGYARFDVGTVLLAVGIVAGAFVLAAAQTAATLRGSTGSLGFLSRRLGGRADAAVRLGLEFIVLAVLVEQIMTLRSRGLGSATTGIDPVIATLPVTVALAAGVVLLRVAPLVPSLLAFLLGAGRGVTGFVATSSARRNSVIGGLAAVVILATLSGSVFGATFTRSLSEARSASQWATAGAGAHVTDPFAGFGSSMISNADLVKLRAMPGITAVAGGYSDSSGTFAAGATDTSTAGAPITLVVLDTADYLNVIKGTPLDTSSLHKALTSLAQASKARPLDVYSQTNATRPPVPALLSSGAAPGTGGMVQGTVRTAGLAVTIVDTTPMLPPGVATNSEPILVVDYQVLRAAIGSEPTRSDAWLAGSPAALAGLRALPLSESGDQVTVQAGLTDSGGAAELDRLTERVYTGEMVLEALLCALAVLLTLAAGSAARRRAAAFLATMGFGRGRLRRIAVLEALPVLLVVTAGGVATGLATVPLLAGSIDLTALAGLTSPDLPMRVNVPVVVAAAVAVPGVALLAVFGEAALRRPMTLVSTLRNGSSGR